MAPAAVLMATACRCAAGKHLLDKVALDGLCAKCVQFFDEFGK
jgi:hypothetical protein